MFHRKRIAEGKEPCKGLEKLVKAEFAETKGRYGVRRITASLRSKGTLINHKVVQKIMRKLGLKGKRPKKIRKYSSYMGKVYLSPVMDLCNREIIGYDIARHPDFAQTRRMMEKAFKDRKIAEGALFHSDQGWQYQMKEFGKMLADLHIAQSMSRKGNCHDNVVKGELLRKAEGRDVLRRGGYVHKL